MPESPYNHPRGQTIEGTWSRDIPPQITSVKFASTADVADLTAASVSVDGGTAVAGDRVLLWKQSTGSENGLYAFGTVSGGLAALTRVAPLDGEDEVRSGLLVYVRAGTDNGGKWYFLSTAPTITVGTTALTFSQIADGGGAFTAADVAVTDTAGRFSGSNAETVTAEIGGRIIGAVADDAALQAIDATARVNGQIAVKLDSDTIWTFDSGSAAAASDWVIQPTAGTGRWLRNHVSLADLVTLAVPTLQAADATLVAGTVTINAAITVAANSEVVPILIGALAGTTNFGSVGELKASRVNGAPGVGSVVIQAYGDDGALDVDAAGAIRVLIFTPQA